MKKFDSQTEVLGSDYGQIDNRHVIPIIYLFKMCKLYKLQLLFLVGGFKCMHIEYLAVREKQLET